jgi:hypothetical protein
MKAVKLVEKLSAIVQEASVLDETIGKIYNDLDDLTDELEAVIEDELVYKLFRAKILAIQHLLEDV